MLQGEETSNPCSDSSKQARASLLLWSILALLAGLLIGRFFVRGFCEAFSCFLRPFQILQQQHVLLPEREVLLLHIHFGSQQRLHIGVQLPGV